MPRCLMSLTSKKWTDFSHTQPQSDNIDISQLMPSDYIFIAKAIRSANAFDSTFKVPADYFL